MKSNTPQTDDSQTCCCACWNSGDCCGRGLSFVLQIHRAVQDALWKTKTRVAIRLILLNMYFFTQAILSVDSFYFSLKVNPADLLNNPTATYNLSAVAIPGCCKRPDVWPTYAYPVNVKQLCVSSELFLYIWLEDIETVLWCAVIFSWMAILLYSFSLVGLLFVNFDHKRQARTFKSIHSITVVAAFVPMYISTLAFVPWTRLQFYQACGRGAFLDDANLMKNTVVRYFISMAISVVLEPLELAARLFCFAVYTLWLIMQATPICCRQGCSKSWHWLGEHRHIMYSILEPYARQWQSINTIPDVLERPPLQLTPTLTPPASA